MNTTAKDRYLYVGVRLAKPEAERLRRLAAEQERSLAWLGRRFIVKGIEESTADGQAEGPGGAAA